MDKISIPTRIETEQIQEKIKMHHGNPTKILSSQFVRHFQSFDHIKPFNIFTNKDYYPLRNTLRFQNKFNFVRNKNVIQDINEINK